MRKIKKFIWALKHRIIIAIQLRTDDIVFYNKLVELRKSLGAY